MNNFYLFINGILTNPNDQNGWCDRAEAFIENNALGIADKFEYFSGALTRRFFQKDRVNSVKIILDRIKHNPLCLVGHSNGCDIIERFVKFTNRKIEELHLIAAASECDFDKNGYNLALELNWVNKIYVYYSKHDKMLALAKKTYPWLSWVGLGYGSLGFTGPKNVRPAFLDSRVIRIIKKMDHSDWFNEKNFNSTMRAIVHANT